jgi:hypothetical protein
MTWLLSEDRALKLKLQGMTVTDAKSKEFSDGVRNVPVRFRMTANERITLTYPCVIIEFLGPHFAPERMQQSGPMYLPYAPEGYSQWWPSEDTTWDANVMRVNLFPWPYNLVYKVTIYSRNALLHQFPLMQQMAAYDRVPPRMGWLDIPQDGTWRWMHLMGGPDHEYARDKDNKYIFRTTYLIRVESEFLSEITDMTPGMGYPRVSELDIDLSCYSDLNDIDPAELTESVGWISSGNQLSTT